MGEYGLSERACRYYLNTACIENAHYNLRFDIDRLAMATYFCELCESVLNEEEPQPELFDLLAAMLAALCDQKTDPQIARIVFEAKAMDLLGFRPEVSSCAACGGVLPEKLWFSTAAGGLICEACKAEASDARPILPGAAAFLRQVLAWEIERINVLKPAPAVLESLEQAWRPFIKWHLEKTYRIDGFLDKFRNTVQ